LGVGYRGAIEQPILQDDELPLPLCFSFHLAVKEMRFRKSMADLFEASKNTLSLTI
jgi:hypothetical protein